MSWPVSTIIKFITPLHSSPGSGRELFSNQSNNSPSRGISISLMVQAVAPHIIGVAQFTFANSFAVFDESKCLGK